jgi:hypothetical protein
MQKNGPSEVTSGQTPMAHAYNPSYSGGRDQETHSLKLARAIVHETLSQKNPSQKRGWCSGSKCRL